ncbi:hypothetical protein SKAU_G00018250 [Synaphobranchus kaupii]|uniref:Uncharacterized protein n=1 Tax=Synaphobranchus kaupii TaxID=118154 RepID=A0A9Q1GD57_SYNKA|nr:hypothetical protein SKAU_G00018250 [Synaphobranchus kaupii]
MKGFLNSEAECQIQACANHRQNCKLVSVKTWGLSWPRSGARFSDRIPPGGPAERVTGAPPSVQVASPGIRAGRCAKPRTPPRGNDSCREGGAFQRPATKRLL